MTRFDEQPSIGFEAAKLLAGLAVLLSGSWLGESIGGSSGSHLIAGTIGFATAAALCWVFSYGDDLENEGASDRHRSKLLMLIKVSFLIAVIGFVAVQAMGRFAEGLTYQDSTGFGIFFGVVAVSAIAHWRQMRSRKRHQSA